MLGKPLACHAHLPIAVVLSLSTVAACVSDESGMQRAKPTASGAATDENGVTAQPPPPREDPPLAFAYEAKSETLRARVRANLAEGASVIVDVFPREVGEDRAVDCAALAARVRPVALAGGRPAGKVVIVDVPADRTLVRGRLDGTLRTGIHGCLLGKDGAVLERTATSLMNAWDVDEAGSAGPRVFHGVVAYADACAEELGENPMFAGGKDFDCARDPGMRIVPITATDANGRVVSITGPKDWPLSAEQLAATQVCDRPAWLDYGSGLPCAPFTRIGRYVNAKGTRFVMICRRTDVRPFDDPTFEVLGAIAHNPQSGKTCFYNGPTTGSAIDASKIPPPHTSTSDRFWLDPGGIREQACASCHDGDPWLHTPWMDQALDRDGKPVVPRIGDEPGYTPSTKYSIFARESFLGGSAATRELWRKPQHLANIGSCGACHRIGSAMTTQLWAARSVGDPSDDAFQSAWLTDGFRTFAKLHWMPTAPVSEAAWASSPDGRSMQAIFACADDPSRCDVRDVPE